MSDDIKKLVERLDEQWGRRRFSDSPFGEMSCLLADAADALEALTAERDRLKDEVERLRGEQRLKSLIGPSENAVERIIAERDHLKVVLVRTAASLAAAISLLESVVKESLTTAADGKATKMAAPSDKMFRQMLADYNHALDGARKALGKE